MPHIKHAVSAVDIKRQSENSEHQSVGQNEANVDFKTGGTYMRPPQHFGEFSFVYVGWWWVAFWCVRT